MITYSDKLSKHDFHAYIDSQLSDEAYEKIEQALDSEPETIQEMQQCMMINEHIQTLFGQPVEEDLAATESDDEPLEVFSHEPEFVTEDPSFDPSEDFDAIGALDSLEVAATDEPSQRHVLGPSAQVNEQAQQQDVIDVDDFLQGINEVDSVPNQYNLVPHGMYDDLYGSHGTGLAQRIRTWLKQHLGGRLTTVLNRLKTRVKKPDPVQTFDYGAHNEFELDIETAVQATPRVQMWKNHVQNAADDALDTVRDQIDPIKPKLLPPWLLTLRQKTAQTYHALPKPQWLDTAVQHRYWIIGGLLSGILLQALWSSPPAPLSQSSVERLAIDSHLYYANQGFNTAFAGQTDYDQNMDWLKKRWGKRLKAVDLTSLDFKRKGATLLPTANAYAALRLFENNSKERISLYVSPWSAADRKNHKITCRIPSNVDGLCTWIKDSLLYIAVADLSLSRVRTFSELVAKQI